MKCRFGEMEISDWVAGRLSQDRAATLQAHCRECQSCGQIAAAEEALNARFADAFGERDGVDLWPQVVQRIAVQPRLRPRVWLRRFAFSGATAVFAVLASVWWLRPTVPPANPGGGPVDENHVVQLVADMQKMPDISPHGVDLDQEFGVYVARGSEGN